MHSGTVIPCFDITRKRSLPNLLQQPQENREMVWVAPWFFIIRLKIRVAAVRRLRDETVVRYRTPGAEKTGR